MSKDSKDIQLTRAFRRNLYTNSLKQDTKWIMCMSDQSTYHMALLSSTGLGCGLQCKWNHKTTPYKPSWIVVMARPCWKSPPLLSIREQSNHQKWWISFWSAPRGETWDSQLSWLSNPPLARYLTSFNLWFVCRATCSETNSTCKYLICWPILCRQARLKKKDQKKIKKTNHFKGGFKLGCFCFLNTKRILNKMEGHTYVTMLSL